jgi:pimeloyl-ACP methyl ester carboxylesterase
VHGAVDPLLPLHCGTATTEAIHGSKLLIFDEMGHDLPSIYWPELVDGMKELTRKENDT